MNWCIVVVYEWATVFHFFVLNLHSREKLTTNSLPNRFASSMGPLPLSLFTVFCYNRWTSLQSRRGSTVEASKLPHISFISSDYNTHSNNNPTLDISHVCTNIGRTGFRYYAPFAPTALWVVFLWIFLFLRSLSEKSP